MLIHLLFRCGAVLITAFDLISTCASHEKNSRTLALEQERSIKQIAAAFWGNQNTPCKINFEWLADAAH